MDEFKAPSKYPPVLGTGHTPGAFIFFVTLGIALDSMIYAAVMSNLTLVVVLWIGLGAASIYIGHWWMERNPDTSAKRLLWATAYAVTFLIGSNVWIGGANYMAVTIICSFFSGATASVYNQINEHDPS